MEKYDASVTHLARTAKSPSGFASSVVVVYNWTCRGGSSKETVPVSSDLRARVKNLTAMRVPAGSRSQHDAPIGPQHKSKRRAIAKMRRQPGIVSLSGAYRCGLPSSIPVEPRCWPARGLARPSPQQHPLSVRATISAGKVAKGCLRVCKTCYL